MPASPRHPLAQTCAFGLLAAVAAEAAAQTCNPYHSVWPFGGTELAATVAADFTADGITDVVGMGRYGGLRLYGGEGNGMLQEEQVIPFDLFAPEWITTADCDADGNQDIIVTGISRFAVLLGNGDGTFQTPRTTESRASRVVAADFNGDGFADLAASRRGTEQMVVFIGNGDGTFQPEQAHPTDGEPGGVAAGDLDGDGAVDLVVAIRHGFDVFLGHGDGSFHSAVLHVARDSSWIEIGDIDGDGVPDIASTRYVALGNGDGTFADPAHLSPPAPDFYFHQTLGDFDQDGLDDIAGYTTGGWDPYTPGRVYLYYSRGDGTFQVEEKPIGDWGTSINAADLNGDDGPELLFTETDDGGVRVIYNDCGCPADMDRSGRADVVDFFSYLDHFEHALPRADFNRDGAVDAGDFFLYLDHLAAGCD